MQLRLRPHHPDLRQDCQDVGPDSLPHHYAILPCPADPDQKTRLEQRLADAHISAIWYPEGEHTHVGEVLEEKRDDSRRGAEAQRMTENESGMRVIEAAMRCIASLGRSCLRRSMRSCWHAS